MTKPFKYSHDELIAEAGLYNTKCEFRLRSPQAYNQANRRGVLDMICGHMDSWRYVKIDAETFERLETMSKALRIGRSALVHKLVKSLHNGDIAL